MSNLFAQLALTAALGEDRTFAGTHYTSDPTIAATALVPAATVVNITGWTLVITVKNPAGTTVTINGTVVLGTAGTYTWTITAGNIISLGVGVSKVDVWRTDSGAATLMALGDFNITQEVRV